MSYAKIPITVMMRSRSQVDPDTLKSITTSKYPIFIYGETVILCMHFVDENGVDYPMDASDTFEFGADIDYLHSLVEGNLSGAIAAGATLTSIAAASGLAAASIPDTGHIILRNAAGETERIAYTLFNSTTRTFTVSHTAIYAYSDGASLDVEDELMLYSDNNQVDLSGDWSAADRATGRISIRVVATADAFSRKLNSTTGTAALKLELRRYPKGETSPTIMYRDSGTAYASVIGSLSKPGSTSIQYLTEASADTKYIRQGPELSISNGICLQDYPLYVGLASRIKSFELAITVTSASEMNFSKHMVMVCNGIPKVSRQTFISSIPSSLDSANAEWDAAIPTYALNFPAYQTALTNRNAAIDAWLEVDRATRLQLLTITMTQAEIDALFGETPTFGPYKRSAGRDANGHFTYAAEGFESIAYDLSVGKWIMGAYGDATGWWESVREPSKSTTVFTAVAPEGGTTAKTDRTLSFHGYDPASLPGDMSPYIGEHYRRLAWDWNAGVRDASDGRLVVWPRFIGDVGAASGLDMRISTLNIVLE